MPSQFFGLNIAYTGLLASNAAMNTTANNIANVQTDGYSRQRVDQQAANALRIFQTYGCAGAGVETIAIERIRDEFYDGRYWDNNAKVGEYDQKQYYMTQIEAYFDDNGKNAGFKTVFDQLMITGMQELLKDPDSATGKTQFVGYAGALAEYFNGVAGNLEKLQKDVNQEIKLKIDEINSLASEIATLNKQINTIELAGTKANELRDRRTLMIDQLSQIVDVDVSETPIHDSNNPERVTGANRLIIKIAGGQVLVDDNDYNQLECVARETYEKVNQSDIHGLYDVYWEDGQKFNLYNAAMGGALRGLVQMRDGNNGEYFNGQITGIGVTADGSHDTVTIEVGQDYLQDLNKGNLSDTGGIINLGNQEFYYDSWSYSIRYDEDGNKVCSYTFTLSDQEKNPKRLTNDRVGRTASIGTGIAYQGIPYYMKQMNEWVRTFSEKFNDILTSGIDSNNERGIKMFSGDFATSDEQFEFPEGTRYDLFLQGLELLQEAYRQAPQTMVLETAAKSIYEAKLADTTTYDNDVNNLAATKTAAKKEARIEEKLEVKLATPDVKAEITATVTNLLNDHPDWSQGYAEKQAKEEIANKYRPTITLTADEEQAIEAEALKEATAEIESQYKTEALAQAEQELKDQGAWDAAIANAEQEVLNGTDAGKAALEQAKAEIARKNGVSVDALNMADQLVQARRDEIKTQNPAASAEDTLQEAFRTVEFTVSASDDSYYRLTAMNFGILSAMQLDPSRLANRYERADGVEQNDLLEDIRDLATDKTKMSFRGSSASEFLQCVLSDVALNTQRAEIFYQSFKDISGTIDMQRMSISGVDEDEEAINLVKYQNGYNLASRMIQTLTEVYDRLILETGV
ncbi:MAG: flagellar hook-associated protein FlgK [Roseburia sp.]|nr:flagellar hook-associated protein FlgK [Roseburia sp.]MCM1099045.1 flagellar hook-associated protein FlgK [Ruminococcus flavefaciens]